MATVAALPQPIPPNYHNIVGMAPQRAVIYLDRIEPVSAIHGHLPLTVGDPHTDPNNIQIRARLNAGRFGLPGIDVSFIIPSNDPSNPLAQTTLTFEPGVAAASSTGAQARYNLQVVDGKFLGFSGGGGHAYDHDPQVVANSSLQDRKRMLRVEIIAHGAVCYPDTLAARHLLAHPQLPQQVRNVVRSILVASVIGMRIYIMFAAPQHQVMAQVFQPLLRTVSERIPPLNQYNPTGIHLTLDMPSYAIFQGNMYCSRLSQNPPTFGPARHLLPDVQSRQAHRLVAVMHAVGLIRENQGQERISSRLDNGPQRMRLVRSRNPVLGGATSAVHQRDNGIAIPVNQHMYLGYINNALPFNRDITTPLPGTRYSVLFGDGIAQALGIVLDIPNAILQGSNAAFVMALFQVPANVKSGNAPTSLAAATARNVQLRFVQNRTTAAAQLASLARFSGVALDRSGSTLQRFSTYRRNPARIRDHDVRVSAMNWNNALVQTRAYQLQGRVLSQGSENLLVTTIGAMEGNMQLVETSVQAVDFRACLALAFQFLAVRRRVIFISDSISSRAGIASQIWSMRELAVHAPHFGQHWGNSRLLAYTSSSVDDNQDFPDREKADLASRYLDDLPRHEWLTDETGAHSQTSNAAPPGDIPVPMSMGAAIGDHLSQPNSSVQRRRQYYQDRRQDIDNIRAPDADIKEVITRRNDAELQVLGKTDLLVTNSATSIAGKVKNSMRDAVLIFTDTQTMQWYTLASTIVSYPDSHAIFICGDTGDMSNRLRFSARRENEAWNTIQYSAWEMLVRAGNVPHSLV